MGTLPIDDIMLVAFADGELDPTTTWLVEQQPAATQPWPSGWKCFAPPVNCCARRCRRTNTSSFRQRLRAEYPG